MDKQMHGQSLHDHFPKQSIDQKVDNHNLRQYLQSQEQSLRNLTHDLEKKMHLKTADPFPVVKYDFSRYLAEVLPRGPKFCCTVCKEFFNTRLSMATHLKMHQKPYCLACFGVYPDEFQLHNHIHEQHPQIITHTVRCDAKHRDYDLSLATPAPPNTPSYLSEDETPRNGRFDQMFTLPSGEVDPAVLMEHKPLVMANYSHEFPFQFENDTLLDGELSVDAQAFEPSTIGRRAVKMNSSVKKSLGKKSKKRGIKHNQKLVCVAIDDQDLDVDHQIVKKVTSRFGRSINVKVSQY